MNPSRPDRRFPRYEARIPVMVRCGKAATLVTETGDISEGGLFVVTRRRLAPGTEVRLQLDVGIEPLEVSASVVHNLPAQGDKPGRAPGVGVAFEDLPAACRSQLRGFVHNLSRCARPMGTAPLLNRVTGKFWPLRGQGSAAGPSPKKRQREILRSKVVVRRQLKRQRFDRALAASYHALALSGAEAQLRDEARGQIHQVRRAWCAQAVDQLLEEAEGWASQHDKQTTRAVALRAAAMLNPVDATAALVLRTRTPEQAEQLATTERVYLRCARLLAWSGAVDEAASLAQQVVAHRPERPDGWRILFDLARRTGHQVEAKRAATALDRLLPDDLELQRSVRRYL